MTVKTIKAGKFPVHQIQCLEYDQTDVKSDGYKYFFGYAMCSSLEHIICSNCNKPIFLDGKTKLLNQSKQILHD